MFSNSRNTTRIADAVAPAGPGRFLIRYRRYVHEKVLVFHENFQVEREGAALTFRSGLGGAREEIKVNCDAEATAELWQKYCKYFKGEPRKRSQPVVSRVIV